MPSLFSFKDAEIVVSLSSAEAAVYACYIGTSDGILLRRLLERMTGFTCTIYFHMDSSGARGILQRQAVGRVRDLFFAELCDYRIQAQMEPSN